MEKLLVHSIIANELHPALFLPFCSLSSFLVFLFLLIAACILRAKSIGTGDEGIKMRAAL